MADISAEVFANKPHLNGLFLLDYNRLLRRVDGSNKRFETVANARAKASDQDKFRLGLFKYPFPRTPQHYS